MHCAGGTMLKSAACAALIVVLAASAQSRGVLSAAPQATPVLEYNSPGVLFGRNQRWHRSLGGQLEDMQPVPTALSLRGGAEAGKGDPRWIVQDREDGKNVGSWHWEERDMMSWFKQRIEEELVGTPIHMQGFDGKYEADATVSNVTSCTGDAVIHLRKGRLWPLVDARLVLAVTGVVRAAGEEGKAVNARITFEEITMDDRDDLQVAAEVLGASGQDKDAFGRWLRAGGTSEVVAAVQRVLDDLSARAQQGRESVAGALKDQATLDDAAAAAARENAARMAQVNKVLHDKERAAAAAAEADGASAGPTRISLSEDFAARPQDIFDCLTDAPTISAYTRCRDTLVEKQEGGKYSIFSGSVSGAFAAYEPPSMVRGTFRMGDWEPGAMSDFQATLEPLGEGRGVRLQLHQDNIPPGKAVLVERHWRERIFQQIKAVFGYGSAGTRLPGM